MPLPSSAPGPVPVPLPSSVPGPVPVPLPSSVPGPVPVPLPSSVPGPVPVPLPSSVPGPVPVPLPSSVPGPVPVPLPSSAPGPVPVPLPSSVAGPVPVPLQPSVQATPQQMVVPGLQPSSSAVQQTATGALTTGTAVSSTSQQNVSSSQPYPSSMVLPPSQPSDPRPAGPTVLHQVASNRPRGSSPSSKKGTLQGRSHSGARSPSKVTHLHYPVHRHVDALRRSNSLAEYADSHALFEAAAKGKVAVFERIRAVDPLLTHGFEAVRDFSGRTVLHIAAWHGQTSVLETLLRVGNSASPLLNLASLTSKNGNNILHTAVQGGHPSTVEWLMLHPGLQALISSRNAKGLLPIDCAMQAGFADVVAIFQGRR